MANAKRVTLTLVAVALGALLLSGCLGSGTYVMGPAPAPGDYQAGLWHSTGGDACYWERLRGFSGTVGDIIANDFSTGGPRYVEVEPTDAGFRTDGCAAWYRVGVDDPNPQVAVPGQPFGPGQYRVGVEVAPGRYQSGGPDHPGGLCYWERLRGFRGTLSEIIANGIGSGGPVVVDIGPSDVGFGSDGCQAWVPIANTTPTPSNPPGQQGVTPGAFCSPVGATGTTVTGVPMICATTDTQGVPYSDGRARWHAA